jgi:hypothetical protein
MRENPYVPASSHPADWISAWDFEDEFMEFLRQVGYPIVLLGHRDQPDTSSLEQQFLDEMAEAWEDDRAEDRYADLVEERRADDERYWSSL